jgi:integrase
MEAKRSVIYFPKQSKPTPKKKTPGQKYAVLEWIRNGYEFPGKKPKPLPSPHLPPPKPTPDPIQVPPAHTYGFRKAELLSMRVRQVNLSERTIHLHALTTKNKQPRRIVMTDEVHGLMEKCVTGKGPLDFVFTRVDGKPVKDFRVAWSKLTEAAELPGLLLRDFRRSAVRNMLRRGISETVAMKISGHVTREVFQRYNIVSDADIAGRSAYRKRPGTRTWSA